MYLSTSIVAGSAIAANKPTYSLYNNNLVPGWTEGSTGGSPYVIGLSFYVDVPGYVLALRWQKTSGNNSGQHVGSLYSWSGVTYSASGNSYNNPVLLAATNYDLNSESATGWQQVAIPPTYIAPGNTYGAVVNTPTGYHTRINNYYGTGAYGTGPTDVSGPLHGVYGMNFQTAVSNAFPQYQDYTNFCLDLVFQPS